MKNLNIFTFTVWMLFAAVSSAQSLPAVCNGVSPDAKYLFDYNASQQVLSYSVTTPGVSFTMKDQQKVTKLSKAGTELLKAVTEMTRQNVESNVIYSIVNKDSQQMGPDPRIGVFKMADQSTLVILFFKQTHLFSNSFCR